MTASGAPLQNDWRITRRLFGSRFGFAAQMTATFVLGGGYGIRFAPDVRGQIVQTVNAPSIHRLAEHLAHHAPPHQADRRTAPLPTGRKNPAGNSVAGNPDWPVPYVQPWNPALHKKGLSGWVWTGSHAGGLGRQGVTRPQVNKPMPAPGAANIRHLRNGGASDTHAFLVPNTAGPEPARSNDEARFKASALVTLAVPFGATVPATPAGSPPMWLACTRGTSRCSKNAPSPKRNRCG